MNVVQDNVGSQWLQASSEGTATPSRSPVFTQIKWEALGHLVRNGEEEEELLEKWKHQINYAILKTKWLLADYRGLKKTWAFQKHWIYFWGLIRSLLNQLHTKCFALVLQWTVCTIYGAGGKLDCKQLYNGLFVYSDSLPRSEPWSFIKNRRPNIECTFSNRLKSGTKLSSFLSFFFFLWRSQKAVMYVQ